MPMNIDAIALFSIFLYLGSALLIIRHIFKLSSEHQKYTQRAPLYTAWLAVCLHFLYIALDFQQNNGFNFSFFSTASLVAMIVTLVLLIAAVNKPVEKLGIVLYPITAIMLILDINFPVQLHPFHTYSWAMSTHILTSIIAFSLLNIAALQAILLAIQDRQLKSHHPQRFVLSIPSLQTMESLLFQMIGTGLAFLSIALISGFLFIEDLFAQHLVHKTVLSILAWIIFTCLLIGRERYGWRGQTAIKWTLCGFVSLLLAYFGSKLVLEIILHR
jgi:ABC-type uncharacterized transport system permease subunit